MNGNRMRKRGEGWIDLQPLDCVGQIDRNPREVFPLARTDGALRRAQQKKDEAARRSAAGRAQYETRRCAHAQEPIVYARSRWTDDDD